MVARWLGLRRLFAGVVTAMLAAWPVASAHAETPAQICARAGTDDTLRPIPQDLVSEVNTVFHTTMPSQMVRNATVFRCASRRVTVCMSGANLPCGKADTERTSVGGAQWCRDHPDASFIPAYATGHATIFEWRCHGTSPDIVQQRYPVDSRGFVARSWKPAIASRGPVSA